jgi:hypothetical protein
MAKRMQSAVDAGKRAMEQAPEQARQLMDTVKDKASVVGERANDALEGMTRVVATAAGAVVGTVQAAMGGDADRSEEDSGDEDEDRDSDSDTDDDDENID